MSHLHFHFHFQGTKDNDYEDILYIIYSHVHAYVTMLKHKQETTCMLCC